MKKVSPVVKVTECTKVVNELLVTKKVKGLNEQELLHYKLVASHCINDYSLNILRNGAKKYDLYEDKKHPELKAYFKLNSDLVLEIIYEIDKVKHKGSTIEEILLGMKAIEDKVREINK
jgi:hypothetical protein